MPVIKTGIYENKIFEETTAESNVDFIVSSDADWLKLNNNPNLNVMVTVFATDILNGGQ